MLFAANLVGIAFAVTFVLLVTRYAPLPRLRPASAGLYAGLATEQTPPNSPKSSQRKYHNGRA